MSKKNTTPSVPVLTLEQANELIFKLMERISELEDGRYRPKPARRVFIPKEDGSQRALSIICLEDKIVQQACCDYSQPDS